ncbi:PREDICTED: uncharacterized protein LOC105127991 [Populus euphratica]|uniref:Uncharacterized protein LOC105127991 n=1 Tax=Populus euphratica TaxID=75702 RepID=A0AAJ6UDA8_POPEU|nr:PREDICTED: uncharacterized protein LOC105127991 [Populus euphratica]
MVLSNSRDVPFKHASPEQFYGVFKSHAYLLRDTCRDVVSKIYLDDDTQTWEAAPGHHKWIQFRSPSHELYQIKDEVENVNETSKTISYKIKEGPILANISGFALEVKNSNVAEWTISYNDTYPEEYFNLLASITKGVDKHFANEN